MLGFSAKSKQKASLKISDRAFIKDVCRIACVYVSLFAILLAFIVWMPVLTGPSKIKAIAFVTLIGIVASVTAFAKVTSIAPIATFKNQRWLATSLILLSAIILGLAYSSEALSDANFKFAWLNWFKHGWAWGVGYAVLGLAAVVVPRPSLAKNSHLRIVLDSVVLSVATTTIGWYILVLPVIRTLGNRASLAESHFWRVVFDLILGCLMLLLVNHGMGRDNRTGIKILILAMGLFLANDVIQFLQFGKYVVTIPVYLEVLPPMGSVLLVLAALVVRFGPISSSKNQWVIPSITQQALPYLSMPAVFVVVTDAVMRGSAPMIVMGTIIGCGLTLTLLILRQLIAFQENRELLVNLGEAYGRLEEQSELIEAKNGELLTLNDELDTALRTVEKANLSLSSLATTDGLTGLPNQRAFQTRLREEISRATRHNSSVSLVMIDVDHFKSYNDNFGHPAGDEVLKLVSFALRAAVRDVDFLARYGGEEFVCILPESSEDEAMEICERMRKAIEDLAPKHRKVTASFGVAEWDSQVVSVQELLERADFSLYAAKKRGRNRVVAHSQMPQEMSPVPAEVLVKSDSNKALLGATLLAIETASGFNRPHHAAERDRRSLEGMLASLELRDVETEGHTERVMWMSLRLAIEMWKIGKFDADPQLLRELSLGALLHDIGKIGISDQILHKPARLDEQEFAMMKRHTVLGARFIERFPHLGDALPVVRSHHESWNGSGYPDGLVGEEIPLTARIFTLCDSYDAMVSNRAYQSARAVDFVLQELKDQAEIQFDPQVVDSFLRIDPSDWYRISQGDVQWIVDALSEVLLPIKKSA